MSKSFLAQRRTKIVCTIGPATSSEDMLERLARAGMDCARLNFSHGKPSEHLLVIKAIRRLGEKTGKQIAILQDLPGPKFRVGRMKNGSAALKKNSLVTLTTKFVEGTAELIPLRSPELPRFVREGASIFLSDGSIKLKVIRATRSAIQCRCEIGGTLFSGKGLNVPQLKRGLETFTQRDMRFLKFGLEHGIDLVAVSFVRKASDIERVKEFVKKNGGEASVIAKIEKREALENLEKIILASDGLMVARGDMGVENPIEQVPELQKEIISSCNAGGVPVITATQMLESMVNNPSPTRAEVTDVANAIFDGTDAVMLSEETAVGKYPVECVRTLERVSLRAEERMRTNTKSFLPVLTLGQDITGAISSAVAEVSITIDAKAIIAHLSPTHPVSKISRFRPNAPIVAISDSQAALRRSKIVWGVFPLMAEKGDLTLNSTTEKLVREKMLRQGDKIVLVYDTPTPGRGGIVLHATELGVSGAES